MTRLQDAHAALTEVITSRSRTLLWQIAEHLGDALNVALPRAEQAVADTEHHAQQMQEDYDRRRGTPSGFARVLRRVRTLLRFAIVMTFFLPLIVFFITKAIAGPSSIVKTLWLIFTGQAFAAAFGFLGGLALPLFGFGGLSFIVVWLVDVVREIALDFTLAHLRRDSVEEQRRAQAMRAEIERERERLRSHYERLVDWSEAIAWMTHRPFGSMKVSLAGRLEEARPMPAGPLKLGFDEGVTPADRMGPLATEVCREVLGKGWLGTAFRDYAGRWLTLQPWAPVGGADALATLDGSPEGQEIRDLTARIVDGSLGQAWLAALRETVRSELAKIGPEHVFEYVEGVRDREPSPLATVPRQSRLSPGDFLTDISPRRDDQDDRGRNPIIGGNAASGFWTKLAYGRNAPDVATVISWLPPTMTPPDEGSAPSRPMIMESTPTITREASCLFISLRIDITSPRSPEDLAFIQPTSDEATEVDTPRPRGRG